MPEKRKHRKLLGIDVYICIDNKEVEKYLTLGKPYRVLAIIRDHLFNLHYFVKTNKQIEMYFPSWRFKPRNSEDDRMRGKENNDE